MASADYMSCYVCGSKTYYDAHVDYEEYVKLGMLKDVTAICGECGKFAEIKVVRKKSGREIKYMGGA